MYTSCLFPHVCCVVYRFPEALTTPKYLPCFDKWYLSGEVTTSGHSPFSLTVHRCFTVFQCQCSEKSDASMVFCFASFLYMLPVPLLPEGYIFFLSLWHSEISPGSILYVCMYVLNHVWDLFVEPFLPDESNLYSFSWRKFSHVCIYYLSGILLSSYSSHIRSPRFVSSS